MRNYPCILVGFIFGVYDLSVSASETTCKDVADSLGKSLLQVNWRETPLPDDLSRSMLSRSDSHAKSEFAKSVGMHTRLSLSQPSPTNTSEELLCALKEIIDMRKVISLRDGKSFPLRRYKSCSVVSNSGVLLDHEYGAEIDKAEAVFRFNSAPTKTVDNDYERIVGKKETFRLVNDQLPGRALSQSQLIQAENAEHIVAYGVGEHEISAMQEFIVQFPHTPLYRVDNEIPANLARLLPRIWDRDWFIKGDVGKSDAPTTGAVGMLIVLSLCDQVKAYGMASSKDMSSAPYHYYAPDGAESAAHHNAGDNMWHRSFETEKDLWRLVSDSSSGTSPEISIIPGFSQVTCEDIGE